MSSGLWSQLFSENSALSPQDVALTGPVKEVHEITIVVPKKPVEKAASDLVRVLPSSVSKKRTNVLLNS